MLSQDIIKHLIVSGVKFKYKSYNYKNAVKEIEEINAKNGIVPYSQKNITQFQFRPDNWSIPQAIKDKHEVWRYGKLWEAHFDRHGNIQKLYIGAMYKFKKCFWANDIGDTVKPLIFKTDDIHDLIRQGFAIEDTLK